MAQRRLTATQKGDLGKKLLLTHPNPSGGGSGQVAKGMSSAVTKRKGEDLKRNGGRGVAKVTEIGASPACAPCLAPHAMDTSLLSFPCQHL